MGELIWLPINDIYACALSVPFVNIWGEIKAMGIQSNNLYLSPPFCIFHCLILTNQEIVTYKTHLPNTWICDPKGRLHIFRLCEIPPQYDICTFHLPSNGGFMEIYGNQKNGYWHIKLIKHIQKEKQKCLLLYFLLMLFLKIYPRSDWQAKQIF